MIQNTSERNNNENARNTSDSSSNAFGNRLQNFLVHEKLNSDGRIVENERVPSLVLLEAEVVRTSNNPGVSMTLIEKDFPSALWTTSGVYTVSTTAEATRLWPRGVQ